MALNSFDRAVSPATSTRSTAVVVAAASVAVLLASLWLLPDVPHAPIIATKTWYDGILPELHAAREPVLLRDSPTSEWKTSRWTVVRVALSLVGLVSVKSATPPVFKHYDPHLELAAHFPPPFNTEEFSTGTPMVAALTTLPFHLWDEESTLDRNRVTGYYINGELRELAPTLVGDISPLAPFVLPSAAATTFVKLWLGGPRVVANLHYDATHNIFHQVCGKKRFILFPPSAFEHLYIHSRLHPSHRQSQLDVTRPLDELAARYPRYDATGTVIDAVLDAHVCCVLDRVDVTLHPGDTLYLPPMWFHCVIADEPSVSVNVWSDGPELDALQHALADPMPYLPAFEARGWVIDLDTHLFALQLFVQGILAAVLPHPRASMAAYVDAQRQLETLPLDSPFACGRAPPSAAKTMRAAMPTYVDAVVDGSFGRMLPSSAHIMVWSFVEALLAQTIDPLYVTNFLDTCVAVGDRP
ncbi:Aste57867_2118 [Aphanomyces stellatus]|uniref:Aste57867_2118 protein n=1 Tax=Aphanomyces stellatus TaxID=120398 RepID=A0A485K7V9_9STRA|nr:hypothetical protein As57867_002113 [Aphanomyces stellatus]VFT79321.1 Aste57867_2118 [Aphanomyces stellatus]